MWISFICEWTVEFVGGVDMYWRQQLDCWHGLLSFVLVCQKVLSSEVVSSMVWFCVHASHVATPCPTPHRQSYTSNLEIIYDCNTD